MGQLADLRLLQRRASRLHVLNNPPGAKSGPRRFRGKDEEKGLQMAVTTTERPDIAAFGPAAGLSCRECGQRYELGPRYVCELCFGPLEIAYEVTGVTRESIAAGPPSLWRYAGLLPVPGDIAE